MFCIVPIFEEIGVSIHGDSTEGDVFGLGRFGAGCFDRVRFGCESGVKIQEGERGRGDREESIEAKRDEVVWLCSSYHSDAREEGGSEKGRRGGGAVGDGLYHGVKNARLGVG